MAKVALVTYRQLPLLTEDDRLFQSYLQQKGVEVQAVVWDA